MPSLVQLHSYVEIIIYFYSINVFNSFFTTDG